MDYRVDECGRATPKYGCGWLAVALILLAIVVLLAAY